MRLAFCLPKNYRATERWPLLIFLHGGATSVDEPYLNLTKRNDPEWPNLPEILADYRIVTVLPSALPKKTFDPWSSPETERYLADVVLECSTLFNVDPDRVFLAGFSMGGIGAYHIAQVYPDRFAGIMAIAGSWMIGNWANLTGTPFWIVHGRRDAVYKVRGRFTDVAFARLCDRQLTAQGVAHRYLEHDQLLLHGSGHGIYVPALREFLAWAEKARRDKHPQCIFLSTPAGNTRRRLTPVHSRFWISVDAVSTGDIPAHYCDGDPKSAPFRGGHQPGDFNFSEAEWNRFCLTNSVIQLPGAQIEAVFTNNAFTVITRNVRAFTVWLDEAMVDFRQPVTVTWNGQSVFRDIVRPSPVVMRESLELRRDPGLSYPAKIAITEAQVLPGRTDR